MLAAAPGLVELTLRDIIFHVAGDGGLPGRWVIGGQSLRRVELCLEIAGAGFWEVGSVPKLECAHVVLNDSPEHRDYFKLFTALSGVKELNVGNFNGRTYQAPLLTGSLSPTFLNLTILKLDTNFYTLEAYIATWSLLQEVPLLQILEIRDCFRDGEANVDLVAGCMHTTLRSCFDLFKNLEYLRMVGISCSINDIYFIKHVVHEATNLKEVSVDMFEGSRKTAQEVSRELKDCQRASAASRITIKRGDSVCDV
nr:unnamed protein product [Digitaria exilis]